MNSLAPSNISLERRERVGDEYTRTYFRLISVHAQSRGVADNDNSSQRGEETITIW